jgi:exodeoxyribonuclease V
MADEAAFGLTLFGEREQAATGSAAPAPDDQRQAALRIAAGLREAGVDLAAGESLPDAARQRRTMAVVGRAGTGKTRLLAGLVASLRAAGVEPVSPDDDRRAKGRRSVAILAPTNKAAAVLRARGVPATTIHRILYTPLYHPDFEKLADWLSGKAARPEVEGVAAAALDRAAASYAQHGSLPGALAAAGLRGSDFIKGWKRRDSPLDIGLVDEASMLDEAMLADLEALFGFLLMFGDPAQLPPPMGQGEGMVFDRLPPKDRVELSTVHRQAEGNPILDLAHALGDPSLDFPEFERAIEQAASRDDRVVVAARADADGMARAPILVWRNATRIRLIDAFRRSHGAPEAELLPGEPLICDGLELPRQHFRRRGELETRGLVKGAQVIWLGPGRKPGFSRLHVLGADPPGVTAATIIRLEAPDREEPVIASAARMGASFVHGAAVTIHKAQGSQWPEVQVFAPDLYAAFRSGRSEAGVALWRRLAYVAITRAEHRLVWVNRAALARPRLRLGAQPPGKEE